MAISVDNPMLNASLELLKWLGASSLAGLLVLYATWISFPPELVIDAVVDKSKKFNSESRIKIKNNGKLPALSIQADVANLCARIGGITMKNCAIFNGPSAVSRLSSGESAEISISPGIHLGQGMQISECSYLLTLKHQAKLIFFRKSFSKSWKVELRNFEDGFAWHVMTSEGHR